MKENMDNVYMVEYTKKLQIAHDHHREAERQLRHRLYDVSTAAWTLSEALYEACQYVEARDVLEMADNARQALMKAVSPSEILEMSEV
jgi:hypothetical protein